MSAFLRYAVLGAAFGASSWAGFALTRPAEEPYSPGPPAPPAPPSAALAVPAAAPPAPAPAPAVLPGGEAAPGDLDGRGPAAFPAPSKPGEVLKLAFSDLGDWDLDPKSVQVPRSILALGGRIVDVVGYMLPYGDPDDVTEFALVRDLGSCCFGQAPQPHHVIECRMPEGKRTEYAPGPVRVRGKFRVEEHRQGGYLVSIYSMAVEECVEVR